MALVYVDFGAAVYLKCVGSSKKGVEIVKLSAHIITKASGDAIENNILQVLYHIVPKTGN